jgi:methanogenic corrinoid protein MtbC1
MWERRYGFPRPGRTSNGSRLYSDSDVEALKLIRRALGHGYRPGEVVGKSRAELLALVRGPAEVTALAGAGDQTVVALIEALGREDVASLRVQLRQAAVALGPKAFVVEVAHPVCVRVGNLWAEGKLEVRHEHVLSECVSAQLRLLVSAYEDRPGAPRVLLATLPEERHGLGLEMVEVYLGVSQVTPVLIGVDTPAEQIVKAARSHGVDAVGLLVTRASDLEATTRHLRWMLEELPRRVSIWVGGAAAGELEIRDAAVRVVSTWSELDEAIASLTPRAT